MSQYHAISCCSSCQVKGRLAARAWARRSSRSCLSRANSPDGNESPSRMVTKYIAPCRLRWGKRPRKWKPESKAPALGIDCCLESVLLIRMSTNIDTGLFHAQARSGRRLACRRGRHLAARVRDRNFLANLGTRRSNPPGGTPGSTAGETPAATGAPRAQQPQTSPVRTFLPCRAMV